jgi:hypothetical protein
MNDATAVVTPAEPPPQLEKERQHRQPRRAITAIMYERSLTLARGGHVLAELARTWLTRVLPR